MRKVIQYFLSIAIGSGFFHEGYAKPLQEDHVYLQAKAVLLNPALKTINAPYEIDHLNYISLVILGVTAECPTNQTDLYIPISDLPADVFNGTSYFQKHFLNPPGAMGWYGNQEWRDWEQENKRRWLQESTITAEQFEIFNLLSTKAPFKDKMDLLKEFFQKSPPEATNLIKERIKNLDTQLREIFTGLEKIKKEQIILGPLDIVFDKARRAIEGALNSIEEMMTRLKINVYSSQDLIFLSQGLQESSQKLKIELHHFEQAIYVFSRRFPQHSTTITGDLQNLRSQYIMLHIEINKFSSPAQVFEELALKGVGSLWVFDTDGRLTLSAFQWEGKNFSEAACSSLIKPLRTFPSYIAIRQNKWRERCGDIDPKTKRLIVPIEANQLLLEQLRRMVDAPPAIYSPETQKGIKNSALFAIFKHISFSNEKTFQALRYIDFCIKDDPRALDDGYDFYDIFLGHITPKIFMISLSHLNQTSQEVPLEWSKLALSKALNTLHVKQNRKKANNETVIDCHLIEAINLLAQQNHFSEIVRSKCASVHKLCVLTCCHPNVDLQLFTSAQKILLWHEDPNRQNGFKEVTLPPTLSSLELNGYTIPDGWIPPQTLISLSFENCSLRDFNLGTHLTFLKLGVGCTYEGFNPSEAFKNLTEDLDIIAITNAFAFELGWNSETGWKKILKSCEACDGPVYKTTVKAEKRKEQKELDRLRTQIRHVEQEYEALKKKLMGFYPVPQETI